MVVNLKNRFTAALVTAVLALTLVPATSAMAVGEVEDAEQKVVPSQGWSLEDFEKELAVLEELAPEELSETVSASVEAYEQSMSPASGRKDILTPDALPAVPIIVWALGCGFAGISSAATDAWSSSSSAAWAIGGILAGCIPGVAVSSIVKVILANRATIARALRALGLTAAAMALSGDTQR